MRALVVTNMWPSAAAPHRGIFVADQVAAGRPEPVARFTLGIYLAAAGGYLAGTDPLLGRLLGREPAGVREVLAQPVAPRG